MRAKGYAGLLAFALGACLISYTFATTYLRPGALLPGQLFADDFESGGLSNWSLSSSNAQVVTTDPYHGQYHLRLVGNGGGLGSDWSDVEKDFSPALTAVYAGAWFKFKTALPLDGEYCNFMQFLGTGGGGSIVRVDVGKYGGSSYWEMSCMGDFAYFNSAPELDKWYFCELYTKIDAVNGEAGFWIDGVERISMTGKNTTAFGNVDSFEVMLGGNMATAHDIYVDDVVVSNTYIGPESTTIVSQTTATTATTATTSTQAGPTYTLTLDVSGQGSTSPPPGVYTYSVGTVVSLYIVSGSLSYWTLDGTSMGTQPINFIMNTNHQIIIVFTQQNVSNALNINYIVIGAILMIAGGGLAYDDHIKELYSTKKRK